MLKNIKVISFAPLVLMILINVPKAIDPVERRNLCKKYQQRVLDEMAYSFPTFWWRRIVPHSAKIKKVKLLPSHFLNRDISHLWLSKE